MKRIIVESPYSSGTPITISAVVERNIRYLRACMRDAILRGESPYASHGLLTQEGVLDDNDPEERDLGIKAGFVWREVAELTVFYVDLGWSRGMLLGKAHMEADARFRGRIAERWLGGEWGQCGDLYNLAKNRCYGTPAVKFHSRHDPGLHHDHSCPLWRLSPP